MADEVERQLRAYVEYFRDMGVYDFYRRGEPGTVVWPQAAEVEPEIVPASQPVVSERSMEMVAPLVGRSSVEDAGLGLKQVSFVNLAPLPESRVAVEHRPDALRAL